MAYICTLYKNTGLNSVNIIDTPARLAAILAASDQITLDALDILQPDDLSEIRVHVPDGVDIQDCDYCKIGDYYYKITGRPHKTSTDVATVPLLYDGLTTHGGPAAQIYLDGITERRTTKSDVMFAFTEPDPLMTPIKPLVIDEMALIQFDDPTSQTGIKALETTVDLGALNNQYTEKSDGSFEISGSAVGTWTDVDGNTVTVPTVPMIPQGYTQQYREGGVTVSSPNTRQYGIYNPGFTGTTNVDRALKIIQGLNVESALISEVYYPSGYVSEDTTEAMPTDSALRTLVGIDKTLDTTIPYKSADYQTDDYTVKNNRIYYGEYNKFGIITAAGDKGEFLPEQICGSDDGSGNAQIRCVADPRPTGKPYYRFAHYLGVNTTSDIMDFMLSSLAGMQWKNVPLTYQGASGSILNRMSFDNTRKTAQLQNTLTTTMQGAQEIASVISGVENTALAIMGVRQLDPVKDMYSDYNPINAREQTAAIGLANTAMNALIADAQRENTQQMYRRNAASELQQYAVAQAIAAPEVNFPYNADFIRDFSGNNPLVYKYRYSSTDIRRIDRLLTMYGYKDSRRLTADMFNNRTHFDYVKATGVSIGGDLPAWEREAMAAQLAAGVRVWHEKPNTDAYLNNPIKTETT